MKTVFRNTIFTNVASTSDGGVYWEGMEDELEDGVSITDWQGKPWSGKTPTAHPNSRCEECYNISNEKRNSTIIY